MIYLVLSDIHGNLQALATVLQKEKGNYDAIINLGDVVNYAAGSNECVQLLGSLENITNIRGNHEDYFIKGEYSNPGRVSEIFFNVNYPVFTEHKAIGLYSERALINDICFTHTLHSQYIFADTNTEVSRVCCIGHSHRQYRNSENKYEIINPGSVGQNREFINIISYALYDAAKNEFYFKNIVYDVDRVINEMISKKFPAECINYYQQKNRA